MEVIDDTARHDPTMIGQELVARLERLPVTQTHILVRLVVGCATFFDGYTSLAIAYAVPVLFRLWHLSPKEVGVVISAGFAGQLLGALIFGFLAERIGRLRALTFCVAIYALMSVACIFTWSLHALVIFRFIQGIGVGGEVPVAATYINEFSSAKRRGRFFLLYELLFSIGLMASGFIGYLLVPVYGWRVMFIIGAIPALLIAPLSLFLPESPRWLVSKNRLNQAKAIIEKMENRLLRKHINLPPPTPVTTIPTKVLGNWRELFSPHYRRRTFMLWALWFCAFIVNNGLVTWLPTLYRVVFHLPLNTSLLFGLITTTTAIGASLLCAIYIDKVGRRRWYICAFFFASLLFLVLGLLESHSFIGILLFASCGYAAMQTITLSLYLYTGELYPTRIRALGTGIGSAWLRLASTIAPLLVGIIVSHYSISLVFIMFAGFSAVGGIVTLLFAIASEGKVLESLSP